MTSLDQILIDATKSYYTQIIIATKPLSQG